MLNSLSITNYRNLKELKLNSLGRVNLITGKNNTGKSSLLEAIAIYAKKGDLNFIGELLNEHGENIKEANISINITEANIKIISSLFNNRSIGFQSKDAISISSKNDEPANKYILIQFVKYDDYPQDMLGIARKEISPEETDYKIGLKIEHDENLPYIESLDKVNFYNRFYLEKIGDKVHFIRARNVDGDSNGTLFDNIALSDREQYVIEALKIIEPLTERIAFIGDGSTERKAVIKLSDSNQILPLQSMGDGINRILAIILAMVNCENGFLLIDEFENGLHYSVQEKLWKIIFKLSKELNIQVFATTHSNDCIGSFASILNASDDISDGKLIRLDNKNGVIKPVEFDAKELKVADDQDIEIR